MWSSLNVGYVFSWLYCCRHLCPIEVRVLLVHNKHVTSLTEVIRRHSSPAGERGIIQRETDYDRTMKRSQTMFFHTVSFFSFLLSGILYWAAFLHVLVVPFVPWRQTFCRSYFICFCGVNPALIIPSSLLVSCLKETFVICWVLFLNH